MDRCLGLFGGLLLLVYHCFDGLVIRGYLLRLSRLVAHSLFRHQPDRTLVPNSKLKADFHKADTTIHQITELLEAAGNFLSSFSQTLCR